MRLLALVSILIGVVYSQWGGGYYGGMRPYGYYPSYPSYYPPYPMYQQPVVYSPPVIYPQPVYTQVYRPSWQFSGYSYGGGYSGYGGGYPAYGGYQPYGYYPIGYRKKA